MSNAKGHPPREVKPVSIEKPDDPSRTKSSGRPAFDSRGNAVWEWKTETGQFSVDINTQRLKKLEAPELSLEDTTRIKKAEKHAKKPDPNVDIGFNPYDRGAASVPQKTPSTSKPAAPAPARKPVKDLKRLQEWMEMKKRLANQKDDD